MLDSQLEAGEVRRRSGLPWRLPDPSSGRRPALPQWEHLQADVSGQADVTGPLAAVSTGAHQVDVFFVDGHGRPAEAAQDQRGWRVGELPGQPARNTSLAAVNYLLGRPSTAAGPVQLWLLPAGRGARTWRPMGRQVPDAALDPAATMGAAAGSVRPGGILPGSGAMAGEKTT